MPKYRRKSPDNDVAASATDVLPYGVSQMREYVGDMSEELAVMARAQGDEKLACLLEVAADIARTYQP